MKWSKTKSFQVSIVGLDSLRSFKLIRRDEVIYTYDRFEYGFFTISRMIDRERFNLSRYSFVFFEKGTTCPCLRFYGIIKKKKKKKKAVVRCKTRVTSRCNINIKYIGAIVVRLFYYKSERRKKQGRGRMTWKLAWTSRRDRSNSFFHEPENGYISITLVRSWRSLSRSIFFFLHV